MISTGRCRPVSVSPDRMRDRRNLVLSMMRQNGYVGDRDDALAVEAPITVAKSTAQSVEAPYRGPDRRRAAGQVPGCRRFSDPLFRPIELPKQELRDLAELCPGVAHGLQRLYAAYLEARRGEALAASQIAGRDELRPFEANPVERVRDLIEANRNHFPVLDAAAERLRDELDAPAQELMRALTERLRERHGVLVRVLPIDVMRDTLRRYDRHRRQLLISELSSTPFGRTEGPHYPNVAFQQPV